MLSEKRKIYLKEYRKRPEVRQRQAERFKRWYERIGKSQRKIKYSDIVLYGIKYPEKKQARSKVYEAIKTGKLTKPAQCIICNKERYILAHHQDYDKPLEVMWLCASCHKKLHLGIITI